MLTVGAGPRRAPLVAPLPRRPQRRHRDRLRRHDPAPARRAPRLARALGRASPPTTSARPRHAPAPPTSSPAPGRAQVDRAPLPGELLPVRRAESRTPSRALKRGRRPTSCSPTAATTSTRTTARVAELTWNTFRDHLIAEYEIPKYEGDLGHPDLFVPLPEAIAGARSSCPDATLRLAAGRRWFRAETFAA